MQKGGNVILPVYPVGTTYDLIDLLAKHVDAVSFSHCFVRLSPRLRFSVIYKTF